MIKDTKLKLTWRMIGERLCMIYAPLLLTVNFQAAKPEFDCYGSGRNTDLRKVDVSLLCSLDYFH